MAHLTIDSNVKNNEGVPSTSVHVDAAPQLSAEDQKAQACWSVGQIFIAIGSCLAAAALAALVVFVIIPAALSVLHIVLIIIGVALVALGIASASIAIHNKCSQPQPHETHSIQLSLNQV